MDIVVDAQTHLNLGNSIPGENRREVGLQRARGAQKMAGKVGGIR